MNGIGPPRGEDPLKWLHANQLEERTCKSGKDYKESHSERKQRGKWEKKSIAIEVSKEPPKKRKAPKEQPTPVKGPMDKSDHQGGESKTQDRSKLKTTPQQPQRVTPSAITARDVRARKRDAEKDVAPPPKRRKTRKAEKEAEVTLIPPSPDMPQGSFGANPLHTPSPHRAASPDLTPPKAPTPVQAEAQVESIPATPSPPSSPTLPAAPLPPPPPREQRKRKAPSRLYNEIQNPISPTPSAAPPKTKKAGRRKKAVRHVSPELSATPPAFTPSVLLHPPILAETPTPLVPSVLMPLPQPLAPVSYTPVPIVPGQSIQRVELQRLERSPSLGAEMALAPGFLANLPPLPFDTTSTPPLIYKSSSAPFSRSASSTPVNPFTFKPIKSIPLPPVPSTKLDLSLDRATWNEPEQLEMIDGRPPIWSAGRQELCETLPYFKSYQGGHYDCEGYCHGYLLDGFPSKKDVCTDHGRVIISHGGGCSEGNDLETYRLIKDQKRDNVRTRSLINCHDKKVPVVLLSGTKNVFFSKLKDLPNFRYAVLGYYLVTDYWTEAEKTPVQPEGATGPSYFVRYKFRFEWVASQGFPWFGDMIDDSELDKNVALRSLTFNPTEASHCATCGQPLKPIYDDVQPCTNETCPDYFKIYGQLADYEALRYRSVLMRVSDNDTDWFTRLVPRPLRPPGNDIVRTFRPISSAISREAWNGVYCSACGRVSCRSKWTEMKCSTCEASLGVGMRIFEANELKLALPPDGKRVDPVVATGIRLQKLQVPGFEGWTIEISPTARVHHLWPVLTLDEADDFFQRYQDDEAATRFERSSLATHKLSGSFLTHQFSFNTGATYNFVARVESSTSFDDGPTVVKESKDYLAKVSQLVIDKPDDADFNEVLSVAYLEGGKMSFHDDGEVGLGPIVSSLSLGSGAIMNFRIKKKRKKDSEGPKTATKMPIISLQLHHGDVTIMEGEDVQKYLEHAVTPFSLRFAATARFIGPNHKSRGEPRKRATIKPSVLMPAPSSSEPRPIDPAPLQPELVYAPWPTPPTPSIDATPTIAAAPTFAAPPAPPPVASPLATISATQLAPHEYYTPPSPVEQYQTFDASNYLQPRPAFPLPFPQVEDERASFESPSHWTSPPSSSIRSTQVDSYTSNTTSYPSPQRLHAPQPRLIMRPSPSPQPQLVMRSSPSPYPPQPHFVMDPSPSPSPQPGIATHLSQQPRLVMDPSPSPSPAPTPPPRAHQASSHQVASSRQAPPAAHNSLRPILPSPQSPRREPRPKPSTQPKYPITESYNSPRQPPVSAYRPPQSHYSTPIASSSHPHSQYHYPQPYSQQQHTAPPSLQGTTWHSQYYRMFQHPGKMSNHV